MITFLNILVLAGSAMHLASIYLVHKLIRELPQDELRRGWKVLGIFIFFFFISYLGYVFLQQEKDGVLSRVDLIGPFILFLGAIFVLLVNLLSLKTTLELKRICILEQENITDPLLGIYNRRYLEYMLRQEFLLSRRDHLPLSILLLDIDHFKVVNDTHGHLAGDRALINLVGKIKSQLRETDLIARYGGEEILIMLPHTPEKGALKLAEKLRRSIAEDVMVTANSKEDEQWPDIAITVSIGVAGLNRQMSSEKELFARADQALYRAKQTGRNRCVAATELEQGRE
ncbi:GGDEF domain-containing protein [Desulfurivibrio dismutans]|uniref:GGDEF domain-containing protein n=1 Tax=Desulfurivibrio dismutans TaxID=1398908 RepID=UPI0023DCE4DF|nr:GGDEF domain-containing protein [Desulfurivibrio alkaliphilus]MDF1613900.1 GGDEF domain-containing protein [Desulfurivibrio alkaliphilus]